MTVRRFTVGYVAGLPMVASGLSLRVEEGGQLDAVAVPDLEVWLRAQMLDDPADPMRTVIHDEAYQSVLDLLTESNPR